MVVWESMMGVCSYSRRPVKSEDRKLDHVIHSKSHSPEIPFLQFGPVSSEFHSFPEHHQKLRPRVSNIWTQGTFYIQVKIESDISGVLWKNNNKTKQTVNLASSHHIKKKKWRKSACLRQAAWLKVMRFPSICLPLHFNNKEKAVPKGWAWVCLSTDFLQKLPVVSEMQGSWNRHFESSQSLGHGGWWVPLQSASPAARLWPHPLLHWQEVDLWERTGR